jgi:outer membrane protein assembly factor BamE (lipoprotein component of BamABCDE complex)
MNKLIVMFCAIAVAATLSSCSTAPLQIDEPYAITKEKVAQLKASKATKQEVTQMFGPPEMVTPTKKGETYFYKSLNLNSLWLTFKADGTVDKVKWSD